MINDVRRRALDTVRRLVFDRLAGYPARVYLFGSCARGAPRPYSDIDVAIEPLHPLPPALLATLAEDLEDSTVPYFVDVVDLSTASPGIRRAVTEEGIEWTP
ncbi:nucleotidyltransferase family protein [Azospirillum halopraeferens]|uniref:nucleotidyltransferase family protein n=1 Tax=Azospirillum halopraeferens TaxID=34010 RepID=UPI000418E993|nr:nucleotidyltransferase domain-containing protein [Azospirillum halopraeferens]